MEKLQDDFKCSSCSLINILLTNSEHSRAFILLKKVDNRAWFELHRDCRQSDAKTSDGKSSKTSLHCRETN